VSACFEHFKATQLNLDLKASLSSSTCWLFDPSRYGLETTLDSSLLPEAMSDKGPFRPEMSLHDTPQRLNVSFLGRAAGASEYVLLGKLE
jgi:hypothetical protein